MNRCSDLSPASHLAIYLAIKRHEGVSSVRWIEYVCRRFITEAPAPENMHELGLDHALAWVDGMLKRGLKPGAVKSYESGVWPFLSWLHERGCVSTHIPSYLRQMRVKPQDRKRRWVTDQIKQDLVAAALARPEHSLRNAAIVEVLWDVGSRRTELSRVRLQDVDLDGRGFLGSDGMPLPNITFRETKSGISRTVGLGEAARRALRDYIEHERGKSPGPLFLGRGGRGMTSNALKCVIQSLAESAGVEVSSHDFRRAAARRMREAGLDIGHVMYQLGHSDPQMTRLYAGENGEQQAALEAYHLADKGIRTFDGVRTNRWPAGRKRGA